MRLGEWWHRLRTVIRTNKRRIQMLLILIVAAGLSLVGGFWCSGVLGSLLLNLGTEFIGAVMIYLLIDWALRRAEELDDLIRGMGSPARDTAVSAAAALQRQGKLGDGSLSGADLEGADLREASLDWANLKRVSLFGANLTGTSLWGANLVGADLAETNLNKAILRSANLTGARLMDASLHEADLTSANLSGSNLYAAGLRQAVLTRTEFNERTILPDGNKWTPETDMGRFTDPGYADS